MFLVFDQAKMCEAFVVFAEGLDCFGWVCGVEGEAVGVVEDLVWFCAVGV